MELSGIIFIQVLIIFMLMAVGFVLTKAGKLTDDGVKQMTEILLVIVTPCVLINAYQKDWDKELVSNLISAVLFSFVSLVVSILLCTAVFRKESSLKYRVSIFASVYSNCGFMAIPLLSAALGDMGVFYGSAYLAIFTILYWTHGIAMYAGSLNEISARKIITNPGIIGTVTAVLLFAFQIKLPYAVGQTVSYLASLNTPLAMIIMGTYLAKVNIREALKNKSIYVVTALRLIVIPLITILFIKVVNIDDTVTKTILISSSCPTAAATALLASKYNLDAKYATEIVAVTTLLSIVTIPLILLLF